MKAAQRQRSLRHPAYAIDDHQKLRSLPMASKNKWLGMTYRQNGIIKTLNLKNQGTNKPQNGGIFGMQSLLRLG